MSTSQCETKVDRYNHKFGQGNVYNVDAISNVNSSGRKVYACRNEGGVALTGTGMRLSHSGTVYGLEDKNGGVSVGKATVGLHAGLGVGYDAQLKVVESRAGPVSAHLGASVSSGLDCSDGVSGKFLGFGFGITSSDGISLSLPTGGISFKPW
mmetsp:Transcript_12116/g.22662  ORF Transcript_12116/g.22662 Transcript_12116/m.22662 type:complete len:153 (+) Transcript_12116:78-536(+)